MQKYSYSFIAAVLFILLFLGAVPDIRDFLFGEIYLKLRGNKSDFSEIDSLRAENLFLRQQLNANNDFNEQPQFIKANIYSTYPLNTRSEIVIDKGTREGIKTGASVFFEEKIFFGFVSEVRERTSVVKTFFDGSVEIPVRIGEQGIDGLLKGGTNPRVTLIEKNDQIAKDDTIVIADSRFPFGLIIGTVQEIRDSETKSFKEATVLFPYTITKLHAIYVAH